MEQNNHVQPIDLSAFLLRLRVAFLRLWAVLLAVTILAGLLMFARSKKNYVPMYEAKAIFTVEAGLYSDDIFHIGAYYDHYLAQQLAEVFPRVMTLEVMNDLVVQELDKGYINGTATAKSVADSNMLILTVRSLDPYDAYDYLCAIIDCFPEVARVMVDNPQIKIMVPPALPTEPYNAPPGMDAFIKGIILGIVASIAILAVYALMSRTIQTTNELKKAINLPILIALPKVIQKKRRNAVTPLIASGVDPDMAESLRGLRMKVKKTLTDNGGKVISVTSTLPGEGKTTVSANLAQALLQDGHRVLLLDADLRNQSVARAFGQKEVGSNLLEHLKEHSQSVFDSIRVTENGLDFLSGRSIDKRHYAIDPIALRKLLAILSEKYDYIVIDTPPCEVVSDAASLCRCADCVLYVIRQDHTQKGQIINAVTSLHQKDIRIAGCVFNGVSKLHHGYGYGYHATYSYSRGGKYSYSRGGKYSKYSKYSAPSEIVPE